MSLRFCAKRLTGHKLRITHSKCFPSEDDVFMKSLFRSAAAFSVGMLGSRGAVDSSDPT